MKLLFLIAALLLAGMARSYAQCAVALCNQTGSWGAEYNGGHEHYTDDELKELALKECRKGGGTNCKIMGIDNQPGWWALMSGRNINGGIVAKGTEGQASESIARADVLRQYREAGGIDPANVNVYAWFVHAKGD